MQVQSLRPPKGNSLHKNTSYNIYNPFFAQLNLLPNPQNPMLYNWPDTSKMPLPSGNLHSHIIHVPWTHPTQHSKLHLDQFSRYCTAHGIESLYFTMLVKTRLTHNFKNQSLWRCIFQHWCQWCIMTTWGHTFFKFSQLIQWQCNAIPFTFTLSHQ